MKRFLSLALALTMAASLCACGSSTSSSKAASSAAAGSASTASSGAASSSGSTVQADGKTYQKATYKLSYATGDTGMDGIGAIKFQELVEGYSGGAVKIDRYPNCQLSGGDMVRHVEMLIAGGAFELAIISENSFSSVDQTFQVTSIPFSFGSYADAYKYADSTGGEFSKQLFAKQGIVRLDTFSNGIMQFANNKHEIKTPADMKNLKMRTYGDLQMSLMRSLGADPTQLSWSELYSALQTGAVDGNMNGYQTLYSGSLQEVQPYITEVNVTWAAYDFLANQGSWDKMPADTQALLQKCATEASKYARDYMDQKEADCKKAMIDYGCTVYVPTADEMTQFKEAAKPTIDEYKKICGEDACKAWGIQ